MEVHVAPAGDDGASGSAGAPVRTLRRARDIARALPRTGPIDVVLADGTYALSEPLALREADGGAGHPVTWRAAEGARPVLSGGLEVGGWRESRVGRGIWEADAPRGLAPRQLWVNDRLARAARVELPRSGVAFTEEGLVLGEGLLPAIGAVAQPRRMEVLGLGYFTARISPVDRVEGRTLLMRQPAWGNNTWGYDTLARPVSEADAQLFLCGALDFLTEPNQWHVDPEAGRVYFMPEPGTDMAAARAVLPRLDHLVSIAGRHDRKLRDLHLTGLRFSHTSWLGPSSDEGYANQQSGAFLVGPLDRRPADAIETCSWGCPGFEATRNEWHQIPAAVQVSAVERVSLTRNVFAHLGQVALGIGNNPDAHAGGPGLGAVAVEVSENVFTDLAGGAIMAGGICRDAHHPSRPELGNRHLVVRSNRIHKVSQDYMDNAAILSTYVDRALILHNEITETPYDGIDIGWGWGINDPGGNPTYRIRERAHYDWPENLVYERPTLHRDVVVAWNRLHRIKQQYEDGGAIYNLSASPGTVIAENHVFDVPGRIALYLDEGSRHVTIRDNVVEGARLWLNANTIDPFFPERITVSNRATGNWHDTAEVGGQWTAFQDNLILDDHLIADGEWPEEARRVMERAGIEPTARLPDYPLDGA